MKELKLKTDLHPEGILHKNRIDLTNQSEREFFPCPLVYVYSNIIFDFDGDEYHAIVYGLLQETKRRGGKKSCYSFFVKAPGVGWLCEYLHMALDIVKELRRINGLKD